MQRKSTASSCAKIGLTTVLTVPHHGAIGPVEEKLYATARYETHNLRFYTRDRHYLDPPPLCFWCRLLFRRVREIQRFYDSATAFHFTFFQPLWIQPLWIQRLRLWIFGWGWNRRRTSHHYSAVSTCSNRPS